MSQGDIDDFIESVQYGTTTPTCVTAAVVTRGIPVSGRHYWGCTALHWAVCLERCDVVVALLAAGANPNVKNDDGVTSAWWGAYYSTMDILQLLIDGGGSVNEPSNLGLTPLITLTKNNFGNAAARLQVLLRCPELDLDAIYDGKMAQEWAVRRGHPELAAVIAEERRRRERWSTVRCAWVAATVCSSRYSTPYFHTLS